MNGLIAILKIAPFDMELVSRFDHMLLHLLHNCVAIRRALSKNIHNLNFREIASNSVNSLVCWFRCVGGQDLVGFST